MNAPGRRLRPRSRPPAVLRAVAALGAVAVVAANAALMLSDRAPGVLERLGGGFARRLSERIDADSPARLQQLADADLTGSDTAVHVAVWAVSVVMVGFAVWTWRGLVLGAIAVLGVSLVVEAAQGRYSDTRVVEVSDAAANGLGVLVGAGVVAVAYSTWSVLAAAVGGLSRGSTRAGHGWWEDDSSSDW